MELMWMNTELPRMAVENSLTSWLMEVRSPPVLNIALNLPVNGVGTIITSEMV
jgi:hypothetical protein